MWKIEKNIVFFILVNLVSSSKDVDFFFQNVDVKSQYPIV